MPKPFDIKELKQISIVGVGVLGGSLGLAARAAGFNGKLVGIGRRRSSLDRALACETIDEGTLDATKGVVGAQLVILCTPIGQFEKLLGFVADGLEPDTFVTDVGSTKAEVVALADRILPDHARFVGSHPMAGSEKTGVEFARADLFDNSLALVTPTPTSSLTDVRWIRGFWEALGARTMTLAPKKHDELLARISHLPHIVASALVHLAELGSALEVAGPGFADTTRIASGDPTMWTDIVLSNRGAMLSEIDRLITILSDFRERLDRQDGLAINEWLARGKSVRDQWIDARYQKNGFDP